MTALTLPDCPPAVLRREQARLRERIAHLILANWDELNPRGCYLLLRCRIAVERGL